jgi:hypothetical protein
MQGNVKKDNGGNKNRLRIVAWSAAALILLLPLIAMQFSDEVNWGLEDFMAIGLLVLGIGLTFEAVVRLTGNMVYRAAVGVALAAAFMLVWISIGVGIIGKDGDPANLMYVGVLALGFFSAVLGRFKAAGMVRAVGITAVAQILVAVIAITAGFGAETPNWPFDILGLTGFFTVLWLLSAWLFRKAGG